jgi:hypothetical protein
MFGQLRSKREVIDVPERKTEDKSLDRLIMVRKQRIDRYERERTEARDAWRTARLKLREVKTRWHEAVEASKDFWQQARAEFFSMAITSGGFRKAKAIYERMKTHAAQLHLECREAVAPCKDSRRAFFDARRRLLDANRQYEKLGMLRDEMKLLNVEREI